MLTLLHTSLHRVRQLATAGTVALLAAAGPALADFTVNYTSGAYTYGDSAHVGDGIIGSLTFHGTPTPNQTYTWADLAGWSLATTGLAGFKLSSADGNVLTAFSLVLNNSSAVSYYNFAAEQHVGTCQFSCDVGQKLIVVTVNSGQFDAAVIQDSNAYSGADAAYFYPGKWSSVSAVPEPASAALLLGGLALLAVPLRRRLSTDINASQGR